MSVATVRIEPASPVDAFRASRRRKRWRNAAAGTVAAVVVATTGAAVYWLSIPTPRLATLTSATTVYYSDGVTVLARLGPDRYVLDGAEILPVVRDVVVAAEDPEFWSDTAGPITRAVVRHGTDVVVEGTVDRVGLYARARKLETELSKEQILTYYLNAVSFGRGTYGIEAAARRYFGKSGTSGEPGVAPLTLAETMVLVALIRQPYPDPAEPEESPGFDPGTGPEAEANSRRRWAEIREALVSQGRISSAEASALTYPVPPADPGPPAANALAGPAGHVYQQVVAELVTNPESPLRGLSWQSVSDGGFTITTTLDPYAQALLEQAVDGGTPGSPMAGQPDGLRAAGVVVEPGTGRVLAYYGGSDGNAADAAGVRRDEAGALAGIAHPAGGSFLVYPLAAALRAGYSLQSRWQWTPHAQVGIPEQAPLRNLGTCPDTPDGRTCSLVDAVRHSLVVPLYDVTLSVGAASVLETARAVGIDTLWDAENQAYDLATRDPADLLSSGTIAATVAVGQCAVTVLDQANAMATFAAGGLRAPAHFVREVQVGGEVIFGEALPAPDAPRVLDAAALANLGQALAPPGGGTGVAVHSGAAPIAAVPDANSDAWSIGYTSALAVAIWVGRAGDAQPLIDKDGSAVDGSGLPSQILRSVLDQAQTPQA